MEKYNIKDITEKLTFKIGQYALLNLAPSLSVIKVVENINMVDFFIFLNNNGQERNLLIKLATFHYWKNLKHEDWIVIITKSPNIGLYHLITFLHTFLEVSYIDVVLNDNYSSQTRKNYVRTQFIHPELSGYPTAYLYDKELDIDLISRYTISIEALKDTKKKLLSQGAEEAIKAHYYLR